MCLVAALLANAVLSIDPFYLRIFLLHELVYLGAFTSLWFTQSSRQRSLLKRSDTPTGVDAAMPVGQNQHAPAGQADTWPTTVHAVGSEE